MDIKDPFLGWPIKLLKKNPYLMYKNKKDRDKLIKAARKNVYHSDIVEVKTPNGDIIAAEVQLFCPSKDDNIKGIIRPLAIKDDEEK
ncbi:MAG: hypothetical protein GY834_05350 [Bacteroidetes bacterium]|nr:hypothetical protein [Bacteroidota bacterium]